MALLRRVIGAVLRRVRQHQGRTLREVAEAAGVSLPYLSEVERGTKEASSEVLAAICRALGLPMPDLLDEVRKELLRDAPARRGAEGVPAPRAAVYGPRAALNGPAPRVATPAAQHLQLRCVTRRSGDGGTGAGSAVTCGLGGRPRSAARLRLGCRSALPAYAGRVIS